MRPVTLAALALSTVALSSVACRTHAGPASGKWVYSDEAMERDSCGVEYDPTSGIFSVENHGDGTFTVDPSDGTDPFLCEMDGDEYHCAERYVEDIDVYGFQMRVDASASGRLTTPRSGEGIQRAEISCINNACEIAAGFAGYELPCEIELRHRMQWTAP